MSANGCIDELAPAAVVRAALFPIDALRDLVDVELASIVDDAANGSPPGFPAVYEASMQRQRRALAVATIEDARFARALCLTNAELSRRVTSQASRIGESGKRARRLEATLYRHLARAVWRTEPCDLWAGVGMAEWGDESQVAPAPARYAVSPDLRPYQSIVQALAETGSYIERGVYKLNPTLTFDAEQQRWRYTVRSFSSIISREQRASPGVDALLRVLADLEPATLHDTAAALRRHGVAHETLDGMLGALRELGLLVGGLAFPRRFSSPWQALFDASRPLDDDHAVLWRTATRRLRRLCRRLEREMEVISVEALHDALDGARDVPIALARAMDVPEPPLPRSVLRCDTRLPFAIVLGRQAKEELAAAVAEYDRFERLHGLDAAARTAHRRSLLADAHEPPPSAGRRVGPIRTQESAWRAAGADPLVGSRLARWSQWLEAPAHESERELQTSMSGLALPPIAALVVRPAADGYQIIGSTTEICAAYGRYGQLWHDGSGSSRHGFARHLVHEWYRERLAAVAAEAGVDIVEYVGPCEAMPNLLARPEFGFATWDRWGTASPHRADQVGVGLVDGTAVALAWRDGGSRRVALTCFSPANVGFSEPHLERLLLSSFREVSWLNSALPTASEMARDRPSPALVLPSGNTIQLRRTFIHGAELSELVAAGRPQRYVLWRALARRHSWPPVVLVAVDGQTALPVVRDSPLAVEAVLRGIGDHTWLLSVDEPLDHTWHLDEKGQAHVFELIVPFSRRRHAWTALAAGEPGGAG